MAGGSKKKNVVAGLTDDVLVDILSRLPIKLLCRCKLVSRRWRNLISHPEHRKKLPHTLVGFFHEKSARHFTNVSRVPDPFIDPALSFLPGYKSIDIKDSCNGLLLCHCSKPTDPVTMDFVVCNPATEKWVVIPDSGWSSKVMFTRLAFDPAASSHFHVFEFIPDDIWYGDNGETYVDGRIKVVAVYSSKTGVWSLNKIDDDDLPIDHEEFVVPENGKGVFFNGFLHLVTFYRMVLVIDVEGNVLRAIPVPILTKDVDPCGDIFLSQGHLYLTASFVSIGSDDYKLSVWVLEDYDSENWILKYNVDPLHMFGADYYSEFEYKFSIISIHPEHDMIFMVCGKHNTLMSCKMDQMRLRFIRQLGRSSCAPYIPYVPLFLESLADEEQEKSYRN